MSFLTSLKEMGKEYAQHVPGRNAAGGEGGNDAFNIVRSGQPADPEFEQARKDWQRLNTFFTSLHEQYLSSTAALRDVAKPAVVMQKAITTFLEENKASSPESAQFTASISKFNEGTLKFGEMMSSYNIKEELESWLAKLAEIKREINQRDTLVSKYGKDEASIRSTKQKAETRGMLRDAATVVKLNKLDAELASTKETYQILTAKIVNDLKGMLGRVVPLLNEQIKTIATSHFWLWWMLSEGYSFWHQQEVNRSSMRDRPARATRRGVGASSYTNSIRLDGGAAKPLPATPPGQATAQQPTSAAAASTPPGSPGGKALPTPPPKKNASAAGSPATAASAATTATTATTTATPMSASDKRILDVERQGIIEERREVDEARLRLQQDWDDVEAEKIKWIQIKKEEVLKMNEEKLRLEEEFKARLRELENKQRLLEDERRAVADEKLRLEKKIKLEEERAERRKGMEAEYKKMEDERKALEEQKLKIVEEKMKKKLEDEWRRVEAKRVEIEEQRKKEEERRQQEERARLEEEHKRLEWEVQERARREDEQRLEEAREKERIERVRRQMDEERRRLELTKKRLEVEGDSVDIPAPMQFSFREAMMGKGGDQTVATSTSAPVTAAHVVKDADLEQLPVTKLLVRALYKYEGKEEGELSFPAGEILEVEFDGDTTGWWVGRKNAGKGEEGLVPANFVSRLPAEASTKEETPAPSKPQEKEEAAKPAEAKKPEEEKPAVAAATTTTAPAATPSPAPVKMAVGDKVRALQDYKATEEGELSFKKGDILTLLECDEAGGWWIGEVGVDMGLFPRSYVEPENATKAESSTSTTPTAIAAAPKEEEKPAAVAKATTATVATPEPAKTRRVEVVVALYDYDAKESGELGFKEDDRIEVLDHSGDGNEGWWSGRVLATGARGIFPTNFVSAPNMEDVPL